MTERIYLNDGWGFTKEYTEELLGDKYSGKLEEVRLPHTVVETPYNYFDESIYQMVSGYRRVLRAPKEWKDKSVLLTVEAAGHYAEVYLNGEMVKSHANGYTAFTVDLADKLIIGKDNVIVIKVDSRESLNIPPFGYVIDYMTYGGIYREVYLDIKEKTYISDLFIKPLIPDEELLPGEGADGGKMKERLKNFTFTGKIDFDITFSEITEEDVNNYIYKLNQAVYTVNQDGSLGEEIHKYSADVKPVPGTGAVMNGSFEVKGVSLWDVTSPKLYCLVTRLMSGDRLIDERRDKFGWRKADFRRDGFFLNGRKLKIRGLNRHQSFPYVGYAAPESLQRNDADIMKFELGLNAARTSHYPQSHYFVDECDRIGLMVFTELPGWQHIGDDAWKEQAVVNLEEMIKEYRNHTSIILWGVRINESQDDDELYTRTNAVARRLDPTRPTGGVRFLKKSHLLEDVYTYNDFVHTGKNQGVDKKSAVTPNMEKPYLVSEYNGHMYPTKAFDDEEHRQEHALRHANVLDSVNENRDIAGSFGWCMFDYNTHRDFGSGDRICYHGVMDMFRNPKLAAVVYAVHQTKTPVLEVSSTFDIGEHPAGNKGNLYIFTNADSVKMYKNDKFIKEYTHKDSPYKNLRYAPILIDDYIGTAIEDNEDFSPNQAKTIKELLNYTARYGQEYPLNMKAKMVKALTVYRMTFDDAVKLYGKYVGDWGGAATTFKFEAIKDGQVVKTVTKSAVTRLHIDAKVSKTVLSETSTYDAALIRITVKDEYGNVVPFYNEPVEIRTEGPVEVIGPSFAMMRGGMGGTMLRTKGERGTAKLILKSAQTEELIIDLEVK